MAATAAAPPRRRDAKGAPRRRSRRRRRSCSSRSRCLEALRSVIAVAGIRRSRSSCASRRAVAARRVGRARGRGGARARETRGRARHFAASRTAATQRGLARRPARRRALATCACGRSRSPRSGCASGRTARTCTSATRSRSTRAVGLDVALDPEPPRELQHQQRLLGTAAYALSQLTMLGARRRGPAATTSRSCALASRPARGQRWLAARDGVHRTPTASTVESRRRRRAAAIDAQAATVRASATAADARDGRGA